MRIVEPSIFRDEEISHDEETSEVLMKHPARLLILSLLSLAFVACGADVGPITADTRVPSAEGDLASRDRGRASSDADTEEQDLDASEGGGDDALTHDVASTGDGGDDGLSDPSAPDSAGCPPNMEGEDCATCTNAFIGEACDECPENWSGEACDTCANAFVGDACDVCPENWAGEACDTCANAFVGDACDVCPENWSGEACDMCAPAFVGEACDTCADPTFTGEACDTCADPKFTGEACDTCVDPKFTGEACDICADPKFTGEGCDICSDPKFTGEACDTCTDPTFTGEACDTCADPVYSGENCDQTFRQLWPLSTARSTSNRPVFRVNLSPDTLEGARITICLEVTCEVPIASFDLIGDSGASPEPLPSGPIYWFAEGLIAGEVVSGATPVWQLHIPAFPAPHATAWGSTFDLELDGIADVLIGSCGLSGCTELVGLHHGGPDGPSTLPGLLITDPQASTSFGFSVSSAGDVNGDGLPDIIVGAGLGDSAHVFLNSPEGIEPEPVQSWQVPGAWFGFSVSSAGDVNGDGYGDVIVGSMLGFSAFLYYGGPEGPGSGPDTSLSTGAFGFGVSVSSAGDVNGDGYEDIICGAANGIPPEASVWLGGPDGPEATASQIVTGDGTFGISTRGAGDLNGDGYADIVVGNPDPGSQSIVAHYGGPDGLSAEPSFLTTGPTNFGLSVAGAGDLNGDGYGDVVVSAKDAAFIYHGSSAGLIDPPALTLEGPAGSQFGDSVAALGDTNGDGFDDLGVGAPSAASAFVYFGSTSGLTDAWDLVLTPEEALEGEDAIEGYGFSVGHSVR